MLTEVLGTFHAVVMGGFRVAEMRGLENWHVPPRTHSERACTSVVSIGVLGLALEVLAFESFGHGMFEQLVAAL